MQVTPDGALLKVLGTHTDISHITCDSNRRLSLIGLYGEPSFLDIDVFASDVFDNFVAYDYRQHNAFYTPRETEIIKLLSLGLSTEDLVKELNIAYQTGVTHRKNLLRKHALDQRVFYRALPILANVSARQSGKAGIGLCSCINFK